MPSVICLLSCTRGVLTGLKYFVVWEIFGPATLVCWEYFVSLVILGAVPRGLGGGTRQLPRHVQSVDVAFYFVITKIAGQPQLWPVKRPGYSIRMSCSR